MPSPPSVHVVIVNWNTAASALQAAEAYRDSDGVQTRVTIVDNASIEEQRRRLQEGLPAQVELIASEVNLGYGTAANRALADSETEFVCISNSDLLPERRMLAQLCEVAARIPNSGLVAPRLEGAERYHALLPVGWTLPVRAFVGVFGYRTISDPPPGEVRDVEQPAGACLVLRREAWRGLGGFDTGFFLWFEDVDLAQRCLEAGLRNLVVGSAVARHTGGAAFARLDGGTRQRIWMASLVRYTEKHHRPWAAPTRAAARLAGPARTVARRARHRILAARQ